MKKILFIFLVWSSARAQTYNAVLTNGNSTTLWPNHTSYAASTAGAKFGAGFNIQPMQLNWTLLLDNSYWNGTRYVPISTGYGSGVLMYNGGIWLKTMPYLTAGDLSAANSTPAYFGNDGTVALGGNILTTAPTGGALVIFPSKKISIHGPATGTTSNNVLVFDASDSSIKQVTQASISGSASSGSYTPSITNTANIAASHIYSATWTQIGNIVTVQIYFSARVSLINTNSEIRFSLPVNTTIGTGQGTGIGLIYNSLGTNSEGLVGVPTTTQANFVFSSNQNQSEPPGNIFFQYKIQ